MLTFYVWYTFVVVTMLGIGYTLGTHHNEIKQEIRNIKAYLKECSVKWREA